MKSCLLTGAAGFVGRHLSEKLGKAGYNVYPVDPKMAYSPTTFESFADRFDGWVAMNLLPAQFDVIIHLAAHIPDVDERMKGGPEQYQDIALDLRMAEFVVAHPPRECFVWPTSCAVDHVDDPYAVCKLVGERIFGSLKTKGIKVKMLRPFSGYGEDQALSYPFPAIVDRASKFENPLIVWGSGQQVRDFVFVDDLTDAFMLALTDEWPADIPVDIGTGIGTDFLTLASLIAQEVGYEPQILPLTYKAESSPRRVADTTLATAIGFRPKVSLTEGIRRAVGAACTR